MGTKILRHQEQPLMDALPVCLGSRVWMGAHRHPGGSTSPNIPDASAVWGILVSPCET